MAKKKINLAVLIETNVKYDSKKKCGGFN